MSGTVTVFYGAIVTPVDERTWNVIPRGLLAVGPTGNINFLLELAEQTQLIETLNQNGLPPVGDTIILKEGEFIIPGFIDTHAHAPQFPNLGRGAQYELLEWLTDITYPKEGQFKDLDFARDTYPEVVRRSLDFGTTTCCYYGTIHLDATKILAEHVNNLCQRAFVGKCNMDRKEECPDYYVEETQDSLEDTVAFINYVRGLTPVSSDASRGTAPEPLIQPILTPRFAISSTRGLLEGLNILANEYGVERPRIRIQTHISENPDEIKRTLEIYENAKSYADVYDSFGLLRDVTILAHAVHLTDDEIELIKAKDAGISHCPTSNFNLSSGMAPVGKYLDAGVKVGLGTDVSGGYAISMLNVIQNALIASKAIAFQSPLTKAGAPPSLLQKSQGDEQLATAGTLSSGFANKKLPLETLFYLATLGGAKVCGLPDKIGSFSTGKSFDALVVSIRDETGARGVWGKESAYENNPGDTLDQRRKKKIKKVEENLERFLFCGDDRNILRVYVQGRLVGGKLFQN